MRTVPGDKPHMAIEARPPHRGVDPSALWRARTLSSVFCMPSPASALLSQNVVRRWPLKKAGFGTHNPDKRETGVAQVDKWVDVQLFVQTAEPGSVAKASGALALSSSAGSRHLANLKQRLGARLVERNTHRHPKLKVAITAADRYFDLIESGIDIAIRTSEHESDSALITRRLAETRRILAASPNI